MKLVIDANEMFSFFNPKSLARSIALRHDLELHSPYFALGEIEHVRPMIIKRFSLSAAGFDAVISLLRSVIKFSPEGAYLDMIDRAMEISPDPDDADFLALAMLLNCPLWSEDKALRKQKDVEVYSSTELSRILEWA